MPNVQSIPEGKGTDAERKEFDAYRSGEENLRHEGIKPLKGDGYDPTHGPTYPKTERPEPTYGPLLVTDEGQPKDITAKGINRESAKPLDRSLDNQPSRVVSSKDNRATGRKSTPTS